MKRQPKLGLPEVSSWGDWGRIRLRFLLSNYPLDSCRDLLGKNIGLVIVVDIVFGD